MDKFISRKEALKILGEAILLAYDGKLCDTETARTLWYKVAGVEMPAKLDELIQKMEKDNSDESRFDIQKYINNMSSENGKFTNEK
jgi:hypothetical protein